MLPLALLAAFAVQPPDSAPVYQVDGAVVRIPVVVHLLRNVHRNADRVQLFVSTDGGRTWADGPAKSVSELAENNILEYRAVKPGRHVFLVEVRHPDGKAPPPILANQRPDIEVDVRLPGAAAAPAPRAKPADLSALADELDEEMTRAELELLRRELREVAKGNAVAPLGAALDQIDALRGRLDKLRTRIDGRRDPAAVTIPPVPPLPAGIPPISRGGPY